MKKIILLIMLLPMTCSIAFGQTEQREGFVINKIVSAEIESSWQSLTDVATLKLPAKWRFQNKRISIRDLIKKGDPIEISLGYRSTSTRFTGYVSNVSTSIPIEIECEDAMYLLKRIPVNKSYQSTTVNQLLSDILPGTISINTIAANIGAFKASKTTVAKVLEKLKDKFGLVSYFKDNTLYCGRVYLDEVAQNPTLFSFESNILDGHNLKYRSADDYALKVRAISNNLDGSKLEVIIGDPDGEERTLNYFNIKSEIDLRTIAQADFEKLKVNGLTGDFETYGEPNINHGDYIELVSSDYPERDGVYFTDRVVTTFDSGGYRQNINLGKQFGG